MAPLDQKHIKPHADVATLEVLDSVLSTNDHLKPFVKNGLTRICLSEQQTGGRGREQRAWQSPAGVNIYLSCLYYFEKPLHALTGLSLVVGLAVAKTLRQISQHEFLVKWPNDVYYQDKKISGNLIELFQYQENKTATITGIGINVNMESDKSKAINKPWTSLKKIFDEEFDRNGIVTVLITHLFAHFKKYTTEGLAGFLNEWHQFDYLANKPIQFQTSSELISGIAEGIDTQGQLLIRTTQGQLRSCSSGNILL